MNPKYTKPQAARVAVPPFNPKVLKMPWIARIDDWSGQAPEMTFGGYTRREWDNIGSGGILEVAARPGDVIRWGQRAHDGAGRVAHGVVEADYSVREITTGEAHKLVSRRPAPPAGGASLETLVHHAKEAWGVLNDKARAGGLDEEELMVMEDLGDCISGLEALEYHLKEALEVLKCLESFRSLGDDDRRVLRSLGDTLVEL